MAARNKSHAMDHPAIITLLIFAVIAFMYWAGEVLKPLALAILLSFALVPISRLFERHLRLPRVPAVALTVLLVMALLGTVGYEVAQQLNSLANKLPEYKDNILHKLEGLRLGQSSTVSRVQEVGKEVINTIQPPKTDNIQEVKIVRQPDFGEQIKTEAGPYLAVLGSGFIILILLLYLMINRENMSDRLTRLFGHGKISLTTRTIGEVGQRISKYLMMFATVNSTFGLIVGLGLWAIGVPYALLWGFLAGALRFIPYAGPATAMALPLLFTVASEEGWTRPLEVVALFGALELAANMVLEPVIYGKTTGVSALALLVAAMFWTWLWGAVGLLLSTPLTVCLAVLGKYVPSLGFFATFLREEVTLAPGVRFYQRLLAMDQDGASAVVEEALKERPRAEVFDKVIVPTLSMAERDYARDDIDDRERAFIFRVANDVLDDLDGEPEVDLATLATAASANGAGPGSKSEAKAGSSAEPPKILAFPAHDQSDALVLKFLAHLLERSGIPLHIVEEVESPLRVVERIDAEKPDLVLISHLPPDGLTAARYLIRRIKARHPQIPVAVARWDEDGGTESAERLSGAGASVTLTSLAEARDYLINLAGPKVAARAADLALQPAGA